MSAGSTFHGWGRFGDEDQLYSAFDQYTGHSTDYRGAIQASYYSYQDGLAGFSDPYGNIFERIFTPRKWEQERGKEVGTAQLFSRGTSRAERKSLRAQRKESRKLKRAAKKAERRAKQYRTVRGDGGYVYKQDGNNCYTIVKSPKKGAGKKVCEGDPGWSDIHGQVLKKYGPFDPTASAADWSRLLQTGTAASLDILDIFTKRPEPGAGAPPPTTAMQTSGFPTKTVLLVGGGILTLVVVASLLKK